MAESYSNMTGWLLHGLMSVRCPLYSRCSALRSDRQQLAGWVRLPMAASEQSNSLNPGMADRLLWGNRDDRIGHGGNRLPF